MREDLIDIFATGRRHKYERNFRKNRHEAKLDPEGTPQFRGMKMIHRLNHSDSGITHKNGKVVHKWLESQVGRPFDKLYSEAVQVANRRPHLKDDFLREVKWGVANHDDRIIYKRKNGAIYVRLYRWYRELRDQELYIDDNGLLQRYRTVYPEESLEKVIAATRVESDDDPLMQFHCIKDIWYRIRLRKPNFDEQCMQSFGRCKTNLMPAAWNNWEPAQSRIVESLEENRLWLANKHDFIISLPKPPGKHTQWNMSGIYYSCQRFFGTHDNVALFPISKEQLSKNDVKRLKKRIEAKK